MSRQVYFPICGLALAGVRKQQADALGGAASVIGTNSGVGILLGITPKAAKPINILLRLEGRRR